MTYTLESGRGRLTLNAHSDKACLTLDVNGAGYSMLLAPEQLNEIGDALRAMAWGINSKQEKGEFL